MYLLQIQNCKTYVLYQVSYQANLESSIPNIALFSRCVRYHATYRASQRGNLVICRLWIFNNHRPIVAVWSNWVGTTPKSNSLRHCSISCYLGGWTLSSRTPWIALLSPIYTSHIIVRKIFKDIWVTSLKPIHPSSSAMVLSSATTTEPAGNHAGGPMGGNRAGDQVCENGDVLYCSVCF